MNDHEVKTYRYLRISMVLLVVALAASVLAEWLKTGRECFQTSISAYYYTPAQAVFVATLVSIGVCMVVLKGNTENEDVLLNLAGMLAPVVALVPTPYTENCYSVRLDDEAMRANVANNIGALLVTGALGLGLVLVFWLRSKRRRSHLVGLVGAGVVIVVGAIVFCVAREQFLDLGHYVAAIGMFGLIVVVAVLNARGSAEVGRDRSRAAYWLVAALMMASLGIGGLLIVGGWTHAVIWTEAVLIALFAAFWIVQTADLWDAGRRAELPSQTPDPPLRRMAQ